MESFKVPDRADTAVDSNHHKSSPEDSRASGTGLRVGEKVVRDKSLEQELMMSMPTLQREWEPQTTETSSRFCTSNKDVSVRTPSPS